MEFDRFAVHLGDTADLLDYASVSHTRHQHGVRVNLTRVVRVNANVKLLQRQQAWHQRAYTIIRNAIGVLYQCG